MNSAAPGYLAIDPLSAIQEPCESTWSGGRIAFAPSEVVTMKPRYTLVLPGLLAVAMLAFAAAKVTTDFDHHADFSRYHTSSWIGVHAGDSLWQERIQSAVDSQLAAKGWTKVASGGDAAVSAIGRVNERDTIQT